MNRAEIESYKGYIRLLPDPAYDGYSTFQKTKKVFDQLQVKKSKTISMNKFAGLSKIKGMTNEKLMKANYEITYKRIMQQIGGGNSMNLETFFSALVLLADIIIGADEPGKKVDSLLDYILKN